MAHPIKHHLVLCALFFHVCLHFQLKLVRAETDIFLFTIYWYIVYITNMSNVIKINKNPDHIKNIHRINRIHGQLKGVEKMIVEKRYCLEILQQTRAITSAIKSLENNILNKHIDHCVVDAMKKNEKQKKQKIEELQDLLRKFNI